MCICGVSRSSLEFCLSSASRFVVSVSRVQANALYRQSAAAKTRLRRHVRWLSPSSVEGRKGLFKHTRRFERQNSTTLSAQAVRPLRQAAPEHPLTYTPRAERGAAAAGRGEASADLHPSGGARGSCGSPRRSIR
eukprot:scaffold27846_cov39-Phaeocystis_antarctica.AAC.3